MPSTQIMSKYSKKNQCPYYTKLVGDMKFHDMKLSKLSEGESYGVIGLYPMNTKFGKTYVLLLDTDERVFSNKTITTYINDCWDTSNNGMFFADKLGEPMFGFTVGESAEYNGHSYNKIYIDL